MQEHFFRAYYVPLKIISVFYWWEIETKNSRIMIAIEYIDFFGENKNYYYRVPRVCKLERVPLLAKKRN